MFLEVPLILERNDDELEATRNSLINLDNITTIYPNDFQGLTTAICFDDDNSWIIDMPYTKFLEVLFDTQRR